MQLEEFSRSLTYKWSSPPVGHGFPLQDWMEPLQLQSRRWLRLLANLKGGFNRTLTRGTFSGVELENHLTTFCFSNCSVPLSHTGGIVCQDRLVQFWHIALWDCVGLAMREHSQGSGNEDEDASTVGCVILTFC